MHIVCRRGAAEIVVCVDMDEVDWWLKHLLCDQTVNMMINLSMKFTSSARNRHRRGEMTPLLQKVLNLVGPANGAVFGTGSLVAVNIGGSPSNRLDEVVQIDVEN